MTFSRNIGIGKTTGRRNGVMAGDVGEANYFFSLVFFLRMRILYLENVFNDYSGKPYSCFSKKETNG